MSTNIVSIFKVPGRKSTRTLLSILRKGGKEYGFETNSIGSFKHQLVRFKCTDYMEFKNSWNGPLHLLGLLNVKPQVHLDIDRFFVSIYAFTPRQVTALYQHFRTKKISRKLGAEDRHFLTCMKEIVSAWSSITFPCAVVVCFESLGVCTDDSEINEAAKVDLFKTNEKKFIWSEV